MALPKKKVHWITGNRLLNENHCLKSEWRQRQNAGNFNQQPGIDELNKINAALQEKYPDYEIMDAFGISCETLTAIKRNCYSPVEGISLDNQSKIHKEFLRIENKLERFWEGLKFLADHIIDPLDTQKRQELKSILMLQDKKFK